MGTCIFTNSYKFIKPLATRSVLLKLLFLRAETCKQKTNFFSLSSWVKASILYDSVEEDQKTYQVHGRGLKSGLKHVEKNSQ